ncbi:MAG: Coenzyme F420 hydrogenase/dehydrogenase, beta subunit C-terminal domain [Armatimonadota bacterium]|nr:MAG: Coenzyme F420 hydrogenase/dehydrogenase, beta subunit C-terminal domain [Armatimonadota bacterium]
MADIEQRIREEAKRALQENRAACVIGFRQGRKPWRVTPHFATTPEEVDDLVWNAACAGNLATYVIAAPKPVAVVLKGCDARALAVLLQEHQIERDQVYVIGVPCAGMIDLDRLEPANSATWENVAGLDSDSADVVVTAAGQEHGVPRDQALLARCHACAHPMPQLYDVLVGEPVEASRSDETAYARVAEIEAMAPLARRQYWLEQFERCIRCNACRNVCPLCYCRDCIADIREPRFVARQPNPEDNLLFQCVRAWHAAGRCVDCGECERACPMDIPLRELGRKLEKELHELFGYEAGTDTDVPPFLAQFADSDEDKSVAGHE